MQVMRQGRKLSVLEMVFAPVLFVLGFVTVEGYKLLFGWWRGKIVTERRQLEFRKELQSSLEFLFSEHQAKFVQNEGVPEIPPFNYVVTTIAVENMLFRFIKGRGEFVVEMAPWDKPSAWQDVDLVLGSSIEKSSHVPRYTSVKEFAEVLKLNFEKLKTFVSNDETGQDNWKPPRPTIVSL
jgi:hypothetical protein